MEETHFKVQNIVHYLYINDDGMTLISAKNLQSILLRQQTILIEDLPLVLFFKETSARLRPY